MTHIWFFERFKTSCCLVTTLLFSTLVIFLLSHIGLTSIFVKPSPSEPRRRPVSSTLTSLVLPRTAPFLHPRDAKSTSILPTVETFQVANRGTPMPRPGQKVIVAMHAYAEWILCARWGLPQIGKQLGFDTLITAWPKPKRDNPNEFYIFVDMEEPSLVGSRFRPHRTIEEGVVVMKEYESTWDHVLTLCPYTAAWVNSHLGKHSRTAMFYPFRTDFASPLVPMEERNLDVVLVGWYQISSFIFEVIKGLAQYKSRWVRHHTTVAPKFLQGVKLPHEAVGATLERKLRIISRARIAVVYNDMFDYPFLGRFRTPEKTRTALRERPILLTNHAFSFVFKRQVNSSLFTNGSHHPHQHPYPMLPQLKSRTIEAAACGALMLVYNDGFNVIENWFEPNVEFVYWYNLTDFHYKVTMILAEYPKYFEMVKRAREKALRVYSLENWVNTYLQPFVQAAKAS